jgi:hypothetical protein
MESSGFEQVRAGVADIIGADAPGLNACQQRTALQRVVHDLPLVSHDYRLRVLAV